MPFQKTCVCGKIFVSRHRSTKYCSRSCSAKVVATTLWREGKGNGFKQGHEGYLKHHSKETRKLLSEQRIGKHYSPQTEFKKGHQSLAFKGMHTYKGRLAIAASKRGKKNPMYGKPLTEKQKSLLQKGLRKKLLDYGISMSRKSTKGMRGLPWIDYQLNQEEQIGVPKKRLTYMQKYRARKNGLLYYKGEFVGRKEDTPITDNEIKVGKSIFVFDKTIHGQPRPQHKEKEST